ncbi:MAG: branched-chain amino acid ABC transporter permease [Pseudonocardiaceae bacterium]
MNTLLQAIGFGVVSGSIIAVAAVGFTMQFGVTNILNLAYGDVMTAAAYVGYLVNKAGLGVGYSMLTGAAVGGLLSLALNRYLLRRYIRHGTQLFGMIIVTLSIAVIIQNILLVSFGSSFFVYHVGISGGLSLGAMHFSGLQLVIIAIAIATMLLVHLGLTRTRLGKCMRATSCDAVLAQACGILTNRVIDAAWLISGMLCGLAGVVLVLNTTAFQSTTGSQFLILIVAAAMLGGVGQAHGAILAALIVGVITSVTAAYTNPSYQDIAGFGLLVIVLLVRPTGLFGRTVGERMTA